MLVNIITIVTLFASVGTVRDLFEAFGASTLFDVIGAIFW
jgi:hypothetical protein